MIILSPAEDTFSLRQMTGEVELVRSVLTPSSISVFNIT